MLILGDRKFDVRPLSRNTYAAWRKFVTQLAKDADKPLPRFINRHCAGLSAADRRDAIAAFITSANWDEPSEELVNRASETRASVACLAMYCLLPPPAWEDALSIVTEENKHEIERAIAAVANPTDEDIKSQNQALRDRINARAEEAGAEAG